MIKILDYSALGEKIFCREEQKTDVSKTVTEILENVKNNGDKALIEILVSNLTENALRACKKGGDIELGAYVAEGAKIIYVKDNGIGMTKEEYRKLMLEF